MVNLIIFTFFVALLFFSPPPLGAMQVTVIPTTPKIYEQQLVTLNISFDMPVKIGDVYFEEDYLGNRTYYEKEASITEIGNSSEQWTVTYQMKKSGTDMLVVTVYYTYNSTLQSSAQSFNVFIKPPGDDFYVAIGFVILCAILGTFYLYKYIRRRSW